MEDLIALLPQLPTLEETIRSGRCAGLFLALLHSTGGIGRGTSMILTGRFPGRSAPGIEKHIEDVASSEIILSVLPLNLRSIQHKRTKPAPLPLYGREPGLAQGV